MKTLVVWPFFLAGSTVTQVLEICPEILVLDRPHPWLKDAFVSVSRDEVRTIEVTPEQVSAFRDDIGPCPSEEEVGSALADLGLSEPFREGRTVLSFDNQNIRTLASLLKRKEIPAAEVEVGDVVIDDFGVYRVAEVELRDVPEDLRTHERWSTAKNGVLILDEDGNGGMTADTMMVTIIDPVVFAGSKDVGQTAGITNKQTGLYDVV